MICSGCSCDRETKDFVNNNEVCYKCVYKEKTRIKRVRKTIVILRCQVCEKKIIPNDNLPQRQKKKYCSYECAYIGHRQQISNWWVKKLRKAFPLRPY